MREGTGGLGTFQLVFLRSALSLAVCLAYLKAHNLPILGHNRIGLWFVDLQAWSGCRDSSTR